MVHQQYNSYFNNTFIYIYVYKKALWIRISSFNVEAGWDYLTKP